MSDFIGFELIGNKELARKLERFPDIVQDDAVDALTAYVIKVWQLYPPRKRVTRKQAYGRTFDSAKQRRYFFWALQNGIINVPYRRTQHLRNSWKQIGKGTKSIVVNDAEYSVFVMGDKYEQARMHTLIGWDHADQVFEDRADKIDKVLFEATKKSLEKQKLI